MKPAPVMITEQACEDAPTDTKETESEEEPEKSNSRKKKKDTSADKSQTAAV